MLKYSTSAKLHSRTNKEGKRTIYVTYTYNSETTPFPTAYAIAESNWNSKSKLAAVGSPDAVKINQKIQQVQADILAIAAKLSVPKHDLVKRLYTEQAYQASKQELNEYWELGYAVAENADLSEEEQKLIEAGKALKERKKIFAPLAEKHGLESPEQLANKAAKEQLQALWLEYAGTGEFLDGSIKPDTKRKRRDQGTLKHYKEATYNSVQSMWKIVNEFAEYTNYNLVIQNINLTFYQKFGDFIMFNRKAKDKDGKWIDGENSFNNHFGSLIKRLKTFIKWVANDKGIQVNSQVLSRKFKVLEEENEIIILSDYHYQLLAEFRNAPECHEAWIKHIDITLFQASIGLRHSDMKRATWRIEGEIENGVDRRLIRGNTSKNKSTYVIPVYLNKEWTIDILEKYNYDFSEPTEAAKKRGAVKTLNMVLFNRTMKMVLDALNQKHNFFKQRISIYKKKWGEDYHIGDFYQWELHSSHDNRRAFITRMFRMKFTEKEISRMVGTKSLGELRKYQQVTDNDLFAAQK